MANEFKTRRSLLWLGGIAVLILGFLVAAVVLPMTAQTPGAGGPDVHVPKMENVPSDRAPKMKLELPKNDENQKK